MMDFEISDCELKTLEVLLEEHNKDCVYGKPTKNGLPPGGTIGGVYTYCFTPTTIGTVKTVKCACGHKMDLTDYEKW